MSIISAIIVIVSVILAWVILLSNDRGFIGRRPVMIGGSYFVLALAYILLSSLQQESIIFLIGFVGTPLVTGLSYRWAEYYSWKKYKRGFQIHLSDKTLDFFKINHEYLYSLSDDAFTTLMILATCMWGPLVVYLIRLSGL